MAYQLTDHRPAPAFLAGLRKRASAFGQSFLHGLEAYAHSRSRIDRIERLNAKSDAELAAMGLTRDRIPHHVFRDLFHI